jgi:hypothetical protein
MKQPKKLVNFRINEDLAEDLKEVSDQLEIPQSQIVRDGVKEKVGALKKKIAEDLANQPVEAAA